MKKRRIKIALIIFFSLAFAILMLPRLLFPVVFHKIVLKAKARFAINITSEKARVTGINTFFFNKLLITGKNNDTIFFSDTAVFRIQPLRLLTGDIKFSSIVLANSNVRLNYDLFKLLRRRKNKETDSTQTAQPLNYATFTALLQSRFFRHIPEKLDIRNSSFTYRHDSLFASARIENFRLKNKSLSGKLLLQDNKLKSNCLLDGNIDPSKQSLVIKIIKADSNQVQLPYLGVRWNGTCKFDTAYFSCRFLNDNQKFNAIGNASATNLSFYHERISPDMVNIPLLRFSYKLNFGERFVEIDSSSVVQMNKFSFSPYLKIENNGSKKITFAFIRKEFDAQTFFESLPNGLFTHFKGIKTEGRLAFHLRTQIDLSQPDSLSFDADLENKNFKIKSFGETDFRLINEPFIHEVYENNKLVAAFVVGPENENFVPLDEISDYLKYSVLTSEDGSFFYHHGFNEEAFRESIAKNIQEGRFARGGSTLTMQLVKNVFLNRKKNISRKIEEALIVWIIENLHLVSKERMFEVYLNIIEWGPGIYGIKPAAKFYFNKKPSKLNLSESIFLSSIIPKPKWFRYTFDKEGHILSYMNEYYHLLSSIMVRRGQISPEDTVNLKPVEKLTGDAKNFLTTSTPIPEEDSLFLPQPIDIPSGQIQVFDHK